MTAARTSVPSADEPGPTLAVVSPRPVHRPVRLVPGTHVTVTIDGVARHGVVQQYEPENTTHHDTFPVQLDSGQWRLLVADEVTVVAPKGAP